MSDLNVKGATSTYSSYGSNRVKADSSKAAKAETKAEAGAVYEKSEAAGKAPYKINKMSAEDRAALVEQLKQDEVNRRNQLTDLVQKMFNGQAGVSKLADLFSPENLAKEKGFKQATKAWGGDLPEICQRTLAAANKLFDDYYASKGEVQE